MPAVIPDRPDPGDPIVAAWGGDVHDRIYTPKGIVANGNLTAVPATTNQLLNISANNGGGNPAWLAGDGVSLKCPVGHSGWYDARLFVTMASGPAAGTAFRARILRGGGLIVAGTGVQIVSTATGYLSVSGLLLLNDGDLVTVDGYSSIAVSLTVARFSLIRSSNGPAGS